MAEEHDWRKTLSFSDRFANLTKITSAYQALTPRSTTEDPKHQAKTSEESIREGATSIEEYERQCEAFARELRGHAGSNNEDDTDDESFPNEHLPKLDIGPYTGAVYHRDGITSKVYKARRPPNQLPRNGDGTVPRLIALKVAELAAMAPPHDVQREIGVLGRLEGHNIIPLLETFRDRHGYYVLVFPFMRLDLPSLLARGPTFGAAQREAVIKDLFSALSYIHSEGIIHRDVKPGNILLKSSNGPAYLADFGIAWDGRHPASEPAQSKITGVGTTCYRAPELLFGNSAYTQAIDLWAAGCVVAELVDESHGPLFDAGDVGSDLTLISSIFKSLGTPTLETWPEAARFDDWGKFEFYKFRAQSWDELLPDASEKGIDLVSKLIRYESSERMAASEVLHHAVILN